MLSAEAVGSLAPLELVGVERVGEGSESSRGVAVHVVRAVVESERGGVGDVGQVCCVGGAALVEGVLGRVD